MEEGADVNYYKGDRVRHHKFGIGTVTAVERSGNWTGDDDKVSAIYDRHGETKKAIAKFIDLVGETKTR